MIKKASGVTSLLILPLLLSACVGSNPGLVDSSADKAKSAQEQVDIDTEQHPGRKVYQSACMSCHVAEGKPTVAPPIFAVKNHVIGRYPERSAFIQRVSSWVKAPNADDVLMAGAVRKFGLMPAMPHLNNKDLQAVAEYLYDTDLSLPDWYKQHYMEEHGTMPK